MILLVARLLLAAVFALAAVGKLTDREGTRRSLAEFGVPNGFLAAAAIALPVVELAAAGLLIPAATARLGGLLALALLLIFSAVVGRALARDERPDCNCFGGLNSAPVGRSTLVRNLALAVLAALVVVAGPGRGLESLDGGTVLAVAGAAAGCLLLGLTWFGWQLFKQNGRLLARVRALEEATGTAAPHPPAVGGLDEGEPAPDLSLATPDGDRRTVSELTAIGAPPIALVFSDPACGGCTALTERLPELRRELEGVVGPVLVTRGHGPHVDAAAAQGLPVLIQEDREALFAFAIGAIPAAVLIDAEGRVASRTAIGEDAVMDLLHGSSPIPALDVLRVTGPAR